MEADVATPLSGPCVDDSGCDALIGDYLVAYSDWRDADRPLDGGPPQWCAFSQEEWARVRVTEEGGQLCVDVAGARGTPQIAVDACTLAVSYDRAFSNPSETYTEQVRLSLSADAAGAEGTLAYTLRGGSSCDLEATVSATRELCSWLASGARFESRELLWCSAGWAGDAAPPEPDAEPGLYCNWSLAFEDDQVDWLELDYGGQDSFTCSDHTVAITSLGAGTWDPARRVLTFEGVEYLPVD
jgi:hypothetical protein